MCCVGRQNFRLPFWLLAHLFFPDIVVSSCRRNNILLFLFSVISREMSGEKCTERVKLKAEIADVNVSEKFGL